MRIKSAEERVAIGFMSSRKFVQAHDNVCILFDEIVQFCVTDDALSDKMLNEMRQKTIEKTVKLQTKGIGAKNGCWPV